MTPEAIGILKILLERGEIKEQFLLFSSIFCYHLLDFYVEIGSRCLLRINQLFEISEVEITS